MSTFVTKMARQQGLTKHDAKVSLVLTVTPRDVAQSQQKNAKSCAFACAAKRDLKADAAFFFRSTAWLQFGNRLERYLLPPSMQKEIVHFDRTGEMEPGAYQLSPPSKSATMAAITKRSKKRPGRHQPGNTSIKRKVRHVTANVRSLFEPREA